MEQLGFEARRSLDRLRPRMRACFTHVDQWHVFETRLEQHFAPLFQLLIGLYGNRYDFFYHLESILTTSAEAFIARPEALTQLDVQRDPHWFQSEQLVGGVCYVDLYAKNLTGIRERIPYFKELGLTYLHLMPLFKCPPLNSDGGYAISSFREVNPTLGTMDELADLADELRANGISLVLDFVFNHTSDEHDWAMQARAGNPEYQDYYLMFDDRTMPDAYEKNLREIFPEQAPGSFTFFPEINKWVWTTFNTFQWDLNYANPEVFNRMLGEMLLLANQGVEVLRLDAVAFIWKQMGTTCENLPQAHDIIAAYNQLARIAAPAMIFKSEAIVHPDDVVKYLGRECEISYNPTFMVLLWEALATRKVDLLRHSMIKRFNLLTGTAWVNYVRSHDDIGWSFANEDAQEIAIDGYHHRNFLNMFYTGRFEGSFASGLPFNYNPRTGDMRISGTTASLAGLDKALAAGDQREIVLSIARILLIESLVIAAGGIPLIYLGDELGTLNDYTYRHVPAKAVDSRWVHRPIFDTSTWQDRGNNQSIAGRIYEPIQRMIRVRKTNPVFDARGKAVWLDCGNEHVLGLERTYSGETVLMLCNFSEHSQPIERRFLPFTDPRLPYTDLLAEESYMMESSFVLSPYEFRWLRYP
jgi:amylosucrase